LSLLRTVKICLKNYALFLAGILDTFVSLQVPRILAFPHRDVNSEHRASWSFNDTSRTTISMYYADTLWREL